MEQMHSVLGCIVVRQIFIGETVVFISHDKDDTNCAREGVLSTHSIPQKRNAVLELCSHKDIENPIISRTSSV